ncbi:MAG: DUF6516 family protein [Xanthobacteraceae bacterium]
MSSCWTSTERIHHLEEGYWFKFEIKRVKATPRRPHGLSYSFTLHAPDGKRLIGFDTPTLAVKTSRFKKQPHAGDHWHRTERDPGRQYKFKDAETLIDDFFNEVESVLLERGIGMTVLRVEDIRRRK